MSEIVKLSTFPRVISCLVMLFTGYLISITVLWALGTNIEDVTAAQAGVIAAILTPIAAIFKFSFDFAGDGKIDS
ncbi:hypothetical protein [Paraglaciecola sp.]|uniref:hypothetical protein n=1 Tax=Paraglaciecola sp. TaxID=1920173 RepID=UPI003EF2D1B9